MKIVFVDNIGDKSWCSDVLVCENVNEKFGTKIEEMLNNELNDEAYAYLLVEDDYELYKSEFDF
ncbi:hypothetical protein G6Z25_02230 [Clostridium perfringens]|uniref:hypothetical protein n=1 Tax=Clostridium perfringens TaxID=1502 RepID=UPI0013E409BA|nr:hypothetical protein [Clostridium perfringens]NGS95737.1 hypothetical protein [Clostridium perfringens]